MLHSLSNSFGLIENTEEDGKMYNTDLLNQVGCPYFPLSGAVLIRF